MIAITIMEAPMVGMIHFMGTVDVLEGEDQMASGEGMNLNKNEKSALETLIAMTDSDLKNRQTVINVLQSFNCMDDVKHLTNCSEEDFQKFGFQIHMQKKFSRAKKVYDGRA